MAKKKLKYRFLYDDIIKKGDKYVIGNSHIKTFHSGDMECIEDRNNGAIKVEII